ncbi:hypothetical protein SUGI_1038430 [Cryptomeria japonica]|uniref:ATP-dependent Clp protease proteolytic subunit-related protein 3, chloroplastic n=1 Tax=Cryptomeria japonica TaxID=3369 RepID=UPI002414BACC|nr:ATP-dependent Clp protease proteolytic subunit-related protein 3, chloroplastic [Cryptomeria japonica]GLJ49201.1 hypothetical protein SUGI_1038430 [Cryptomeria japonica]
MACCTGPATASSSFISHTRLWVPRTRKSRGRVSACIPEPAFDPNSPFVKKLSDAIASNPEEALKQSRSDKRPPLLHLLDTPEVDKEARRKKIDNFIANSPLYFPVTSTRRPPPDMASIFLDQFIVCIDYPLVSLIAELIIAQLLYLQNRDPYHPIYLYINSTGTSREDGQKVAFESDGFAIYDIMNSVFNEIRTVVMGQAVGHACLLAAAGKKGWRYIFPNSIVRLEEPFVFASGQLPEVEVAIRAKQAVWERNRTMKLFCRHTGQSQETILKLMREKRTLWAKEAIEFGIIDKVLLRDGQDPMMATFTKRRDYGKKDASKKDAFKRIGTYGEGGRGLG